MSITIKIAAAAVVIAVSMTAYAEGTDVMERRAVRNGLISVDNAVQIALLRQRGHLEDVQLKLPSDVGHHTYEVVLADRRGTDWVVSIDGRSGKVLSAHLK